MRSAKKIVLPNNLQISNDEYDHLCNHAFNSAVWYLNASPKSSNEIREKLYAKGFPKGEVSVVFWDKTTKPLSIVEETIAKLERVRMLDDSHLVCVLVEKLARQGKGGQAIRGFLRNKKFDDNLIDAELRKIDSRVLFEQATMVAEKYVASNSFQKKESNKKYGSLVGFLSRRGYDFDTIKLVAKNLL